MSSKQALRQSAERQRRQAGPICLDDVLAEAVRDARQVAAYLATGAEPHVTPQPGWLLPLLREDNDLDWAAWDGTAKPGRHGLLEPAGPRLGVEAISGCDLVLVPALLVDLRGVRLGKGGGSYDRVLARTRGLTVALIRDEELVDELPSEPHDVPVAAVATPSRGLLRLTGMM